MGLKFTKEWCMTLAELERIHEEAAPADDTSARPAEERQALVCLLEQGQYAPGSQPPQGYLEWHEWAEVQQRAGLRAKPCGRCGLWCYPQELSAEVLQWEAKNSRGKTVWKEAPVCNKCAQQKGDAVGERGGE